MASELVQLCDAIASDLKAETFSFPLSVHRRLFVRVDLEELPELPGEKVLVEVVPTAERETPFSRGETEHESDITIGVRKKLGLSGKQSDAELDELTGLLDEIKTFLRRRPPTDRTDHWMAQESLPFVPEHLDQQRVFFGAVRLTYRRID